MTKEENRFARAINWLKDHGEVKSQKEMAEKMGTTETTISRIKKSKVCNPDDKTLRMFNSAYGHIINIDYLRGTSDTMLVKDLTSDDEKINTDLHKSSQIDQSSMVNAIIAATDTTVSSLKRELANKEESFNREMEQLKESHKRELADKETILAERAERIKFLEQQVKGLTADMADWKAQAAEWRKQCEILRVQLAQQQTKEVFGNYPFTIGAAEDASKAQPKVK